jgi:hypothetical protein
MREIFRMDTTRALGSINTVMGISTKGGLFWAKGRAGAHIWAASGTGSRASG